MDRGGGFVKLLRRLADLDVTRYDRRGYGASRGAGLHHTISGHVEDLLAVIGDEPATVVGHSLGGVLALAAAARRPDLVRSVGVYEAPLPWRVEWSAAWSRRMAELVEGGDDAAADAAERFLRRMLGDDTWERLPPVMRRDRRAEGVALVAEMVALRHEGEVVDPAAIGVPVLAGHGDRSADRHRDAARTVADEAPRGELWVIEGAAHPAHYTHAAEFSRFVHRAVARAG
jgi:pimeloyl-ACP methyl ester carboxylesterase